MSDMHISWHGELTIKIQSEDKILLIDPSAPQKADVIALTNPSNPDMSTIKTADEDTVIINTPGEYDISGFTLHALGWQADDGTERSLQRWTIEDVILLHVGALNRDLTADELQHLEKTDIHVLFVPVGGENTLTPKQAMNLITTIEPRMVIPIGYKDIGPFAKEMGLDPNQTAEKKIIIKAKKLPEQDMVTVLLTP